jgi:hypothetical protein
VTLPVSAELSAAIAGLDVASPKKSVTIKPNWVIVLVIILTSPGCLIIKT